MTVGLASSFERCVDIPSYRIQHQLPVLLLTLTAIVVPTPAPASAADTYT